MDTYFFPFPNVAPGTTKITQGNFVDIPSFCKRNLNSRICKQYYRNLDYSKLGFQICPYGFGTEVIKFGTETVIFTCLNVEKNSDRKKYKKGLQIKISCQDCP